MRVHSAWYELRAAHCALLGGSVVRLQRNATHVLLASTASHQVLTSARTVRLVRTAQPLPRHALRAQAASSLSLAAHLVASVLRASLVLLPVACCQRAKTVLADTSVTKGSAHATRALQARYQTAHTRHATTAKPANSAQQQPSLARSVPPGNTVKTQVPIAQTVSWASTLTWLLRRPAAIVRQASFRQVQSSSKRFLPPRLLA
jgi:hypothetical protein